MHSQLRHSAWRWRLSQAKQRGSAVIMVVFALTATLVVVTEVTSRTHLESESSVNHLNSARSHYLARSGMSIARMLVHIQTEYLDPNSQTVGNVNVTQPEFVGIIVSLLGGSQDEIKSMASGFGLSGRALDGFGLDWGSFDITITNDDGKVNINCANNAQSVRDLRTLLEALLYPDAFSQIFENPDAEGYQRTRQQQAAALIDYVDQNTNVIGRGGEPEDNYGYQQLDDKYNAKNRNIDSVAELKLVRGVDDRFWALFGGVFRAVGDCKIHLGVIQDPKLMTAIIFLAAKEDDDPVRLDPVRLWTLSKAVHEAGLAGGFQSEQDFVDFVANPTGGIQNLLTQQAQQTGDSVDTSSVPQIEGMEIDLNKVRQIARTGEFFVYRVEATAQIPTFRGGEDTFFNKKIVGIWDKRITPKNNRTDLWPEGQGRGGWVYWKEE